MRKNYKNYLLLLAGGLFLSMLVASCKKDKKTPPAPATSIGTLGLYEVDSSIYKRVFIGISKIGTQSVNYYSVFDTGSSGMTMDANGILPASAITDNGIVIPNDSLVVNGITVTSQKAVIAYGNAQSEIQEYGNLAYANVTFGDPNGTVATSGRIPIFLYYKIVDVTTGQKQPQHSNDVFGVGPGVSYANNAIGSPLSYFKTSNGGLNGFKLGMLNNAEFSFNGTYISGLLTIGLTPDDISSSSGFIMHPLQFFSQQGYSPDIPATVTSNGQSIAATVLFDTGTPAISIIENSSAPVDTATLPAGTAVTINTSSGFKYTYTTASSNDGTIVAKPSFTGDPRTIFSINFFTENEFMIDYTDHKIGLKNN